MMKLLQDFGARTDNDFTYLYCPAFGFGTAPSFPAFRAFIPIFSKLNFLDEMKHQGSLCKFYLKKKKPKKKPHNYPNQK